MTMSNKPNKNTLLKLRPDPPKREPWYERPNADLIVIHNVLRVVAPLVILGSIVLLGVMFWRMLFG